MKKALLILSTIFIGGLLPYGHEFTFLIRYNLIGMLFFAFIGIQMDFSLFNKNHFKVLTINVLLPVCLFFLIHPFHPILAMTAFALTIAPTGVAAPVMAEIMQTKVGEVTISVLLTTPMVALALPILLTYVIGIGGDIAISELVFPPLLIVFLPLFVSQFLRRSLPKLTTHLIKFNWLVFPLFLLNILIGCGNASHFVQNNQDFSGMDLGLILLLVLFACTIQFQIGHWIGRNKTPLTYSLALGRKNTMLGLWLALTYFTPLAALGPIFYIVIQNVYNSIQIWQIEKKKV